MSELTEAQQLQADIEAQTAAFLRSGGAITKLDYAGVPIEAEYGQQVFLSPGQVPAPEPAKPAYGRMDGPPDSRSARPLSVVPLLRHSLGMPKNTTPEQDAAFAEFLSELLTPEPEKPCIIAELRAIRADARTWLARLDRSFPQ